MRDQFLQGIPLDRLRTGLEEILAVAAPEQALPKLAAYVDMLHRSSRTYGLISVEDAADPLTLVVRHVLESVAGIGVIAESLRAQALRNADMPMICDLGSGAGLPGVPLAVVLESLPDVPAPSVYLVERREKRVRFLTSIPEQLELSRLHVLFTDAERPSREALALFRSSPPPLVVFRAYQQMTTVMLRRLVKVFPRGTSVVAWKGRRDQVLRDIEAIEATPGLLFRDLLDLQVPFLERQRTLLRFEVAGPIGRAPEEINRGG
ncbi:MAG: hypothetical protein EA427_04170 [Spirochaetaceae bacterium]|nr:MAG: hypothetical protein EA427_04170 [Spirochaetaceae bacterium]